MKKSNVYEAIIKIKEYCKRHTDCVGCELYDALEDEEECLLNSFPADWRTDDIPFNILEEE